MEQVAAQQLRMEASLDLLLELVQACTRKWREACKVVLPKLGLLAGQLGVYQLGKKDGGHGSIGVVACMPLDPVSFLHSVSLCGLWHPAAGAAFSQHWNEQGVGRLRVAMEAASRYVIEALDTFARPLNCDCSLAAREIEELCQGFLSRQNTVDCESRCACAPSAAAVAAAALRVKASGLASLVNYACERMGITEDSFRRTNSPITYQSINPLCSAVRKINELVKRVRMAIVHAYIISHLKDQMPIPSGHAEKKKQLIASLPAIFKTLRNEYNLCAGDFPNVAEFQSKLQGAAQDFTKFRPLKEKLIEDADIAMSTEFNSLLKALPSSIDRGSGAGSNSASRKVKSEVLHDRAHVREKILVAMGGDVRGGASNGKGKIPLGTKHETDNNGRGGGGSGHPIADDVD